MGTSSLQNAIATSTVEPLDTSPELFIIDSNGSSPSAVGLAWNMSAAARVRPRRGASARDERSQRHGRGQFFFFSLSGVISYYHVALGGGKEGALTFHRRRERDGCHELIHVRAVRDRVEGDADTRE